MNLTLTREAFLPTGVFGHLTQDTSLRPITWVTLEHSYDCLPKLPAGVYTCRRGMHRLAHMDHDFETFEILGVPGHQGVLFHTGNVNADSSGCVLLGLVRDGDKIVSSRLGFGTFLAAQKGIDQFQLTVKDC